MINLTINGNSADEVLEDLRTLADKLLGSTSLQSGVVAMPASADAQNHDARDAAQAAVAEAVAPTEAPKRRGRPPKAAEPAPAAEAAPAAEPAATVPEPSAEVQAQDAADEAAEGDNADSLFDEAPAEPAKALTVDDLKAAMSSYVTKYGMAHAQTDLPGFIAEGSGGAAKKFSEVKPEHLGAVVGIVSAAIDGNPHQRPTVA